MDDIVDYPSSAHAGELPLALGCLPGQGSASRVRLPDGRIAWLVTRYDEVQAVLSGKGFTRDIAGADGDGMVAMRTVNMDGRPHLELRGLVAKAFTSRQVATLRPYVEGLAERLLDSMERSGSPADLVSHFSAPFPAMVICRLLGFPEADWSMLGQWCDRITRVGDADQTAWLELSAYINEVVGAKRVAVAEGARPGTDVLSTLIQAADDGRLTHAELAMLTIVILAGGLETTQTAISAGLLRLFRNPGELAALRADLRLLDTAIEEMLRFQPVIDMNRVQTATGDVWLGKRRVLAGDLVQISINAANRDELAFPRGARFDLARDPNPHLAFGYGAHHCLGAALARLELKTAFSALLRRFPRLDLAVPADSLSWRGGHVTLSLEKLPVSWLGSPSPLVTMKVGQMLVCKFSNADACGYGRVELDSGRVLPVEFDGMARRWTPLRGPALPLQGLTLLPPTDPSKIVCVALNYPPGVAVGPAPVVLKPPSSLVGHRDPVRHPGAGWDLKHEAELAVVIGVRCMRVCAAGAAEVVAGYTCANDFTAYLRPGPDVLPAPYPPAWAKHFDGMTPIGPWLATDLDPGDVEITCDVDGEIRQRGSTRELLRSVPEVIAEVSEHMTLLPGDVILTGTPAGSGLVAAGSRVEVSITGIGVLHNAVYAASEIGQAYYAAH